MAFPYHDRDYSLYSTSTNEGSIGRAQHDLDRCAQILNEVLDDGAGILDGVKKRKSDTSPGKESTLLHHKKLRQTNRLCDIENRPAVSKLLSSTPLHSHINRASRQRSSSVHSLSSYSLRPSKQRRHRSLSEQRPNLASSKRGVRECRSSCERRPLSCGSRVLDSVNSVLANHSMTSSEADTLTGVHLDNSSLFGVPPVFNAKGERRLRNTLTKNKPRRAISTPQTSNRGWLKPQASISTQTLTNETENLPAPKAGVTGRRKKSETKPSTGTQGITKIKQPIVVTMPSASKPKSSPPVLTYASTKPTRQKENDVDDLLERTLTEKQEDAISTQMELEERESRASGSRGRTEERITELMDRLRTASRSPDKSVFAHELNQVSLTMLGILKEADDSRTSVDQLLIPFQRETRELREQVKYLKQRLASLPESSHVTDSGQGAGADNRLSCDLSLKVVEVEARNSQLSNQLADTINTLNEEKRRALAQTKDISYYSEQIDDLKRENRQLYLKLSQNEPHDRPSAEETAKYEITNQKLCTLQQSVRMLHTRLTQICSQCDDTEMTSRINYALELCAQRLIDSMDDPPALLTAQVNSNNNSKWETKPGNLAEIVSTNLARSRNDDADRRSTNRGNLQKSQPASTAYLGLHRPAGQERIDDCSAIPDRNKPSEVTNYSNRGVHENAGQLASHSRYSMTQYFQQYHPEYAESSLEPATHSIKSPLKYDHHSKSTVPWKHSSTSNTERNSINPRTNNGDRLAPSSAYYRPDAESGSSPVTRSELTPSNTEHLQSTLLSSDSSSTLDHDDLVSESSELSMATTLADNVFQEGLAQLDANIAKLQQSLQTSRLGSTL